MRETCLAVEKFLKFLKSMLETYLNLSNFWSNDGSVAATDNSGIGLEEAVSTGELHPNVKTETDNTESKNGFIVNIPQAKSNIA